MARWPRTGHHGQAPVDRSGALIEPTPDEIKNGWDATALTQYVKERESAQLKSVSNRPMIPAQRANSRYSPHRWRG